MSKTRKKNHQKKIRLNREWQRPRARRFFEPTPSFLHTSLSGSVRVAPGAFSIPQFLSWFKAARSSSDTTPFHCSPCQKKFSQAAYALSTSLTPPFTSLVRFLARYSTEPAFAKVTKDVLVAIFNIYFWFLFYYISQHRLTKLSFFFFMKHSSLSV